MLRVRVTHTGITTRYQVHAKDALGFGVRRLVPGDEAFLSLAV